MTAAPERPRRADAERNRRRLLDAAAAALASRGLDVSVSEIAQQAGVGQGTVFRHFPTKDDLVAAVLVDRIDELTATAEEAVDLRGFMEAFVRSHLDDRCLFDAAKTRVLGDPAVSAARERLSEAIDGVVARAHEAGELRRDVEATDLPFLAVGVSHAVGLLAEREPEIWRRYLAIVLDGLRPGGSALPVPALTQTVIEQACADASRRARR